jgi:hypothetical protein
MKSASVKNMEDLFEETLEQEKDKNEYLKEQFDSTVITCSWMGDEENKNKFRVGLFNKQHFGKRLVEIDIIMLPFCIPMII